MPIVIYVHIKYTINESIKSVSISSLRQFKFSQIVVDSTPHRTMLDGLVRIVSSVYLLLVGSLRAASFVDTSATATRKRRRARRCVQLVSVAFTNIIV